MRVTKADHPDELRRDRVRGEAEFIFGSRARPGWRRGQRRR
jgi:hypothetical protein